MRIISAFDDKYFGVRCRVILEPGDAVHVQTDCDDRGAPRVIKAHSEPYFKSTAWLLEAVATPYERERDRMLSARDNNSTT